jgi:hypothetical protein
MIAVMEDSVGRWDPPSGKFRGLTCVHVPVESREITAAYFKAQPVTLAKHVAG